MFTGLHAFPLTPMRRDAVDEATFVQNISRLAGAQVDGITALGSTGSYAYLSREERDRVGRLAVEHAGSVPVTIGVSALRTSHVLAHVRDAEAAGANGVLLAPMSYQPLTDTDVVELYRTVTGETDLPVVVYDNPGTTHFTFTLDLYERIAALPGIRSIKIPAVPAEVGEARERVLRIRNVIPDHITIGVSGDASAAVGLIAGCDAWYSVIGGTLPELALMIVRAVQRGEHGVALEQSVRLDELWKLFAEHGSLRVVAALAEYLGFVGPKSLPLPIQGLTEAERARVITVAKALHL